MMERRCSKTIRTRSHNTSSIAWNSPLIATVVLVSILQSQFPLVDAFTTTLRNHVTTTTNTIPSFYRRSPTTAIYSLFSSVENDVNEKETIGDAANNSNNKIGARRSDIKIEQMDRTINANPNDEGSILPPALSSITNRIAREFEVLSDSASITYRYVIKTKFQNGGGDDNGALGDGLPETLVKLCDAIDDERAHLAVTTTTTTTEHQHHQQPLTLESNELRKSALELARYHLLIKLMKDDYPAYIATASFLSPSRIPRLDLPNTQDVPLNDILPSMASPNINDILVDDCTLDDLQFQESLLDKALLWVFRFLVQKNTNGVSSPLPGILGLLEQGRKYMLQPNQTDTRQHEMVRETLADLMTPVLPPFYRIFMSGIVPPGLNDTALVGPYAGKQIGPWFYAPWLTTMITPIFFGFLVGPSYPNRRKDGERGGLVVEKCKFLQESGCKGMCLNICKLPTQQFFKDELGLDLSVSPNFATQECQWSFGETPLPPEEDPSFPRGCLVGCESRAIMADTYEDTRGSCS